MNDSIKKYTVPVVSGVILVVLCIVFIISFYYESRATMVKLVVQDLQVLNQAFQAIDKDCGIIDFDHQKNNINFLNVISFAGSEVGSMNLRYPDKWQGPYMQDNPTIQGREYQVVHTAKGYFITPGNGVKLPNGTVIGTDIKLDKNVDIASMMYEKDVLLFDNQSFALPLELPSNASSLAKLADMIALYDDGE